MQVACKMWINPKILQLNVKDEFETYISQETSSTKILNDQTFFQANVVFDTAIHVNSRQ